MSQDPMQELELRFARGEISEDQYREHRDALMGKGKTERPQGPSGTPAYFVTPTNTLNFLEAVRTGLRRYGKFSGRTRRSEYWWCRLLEVPIFIALYVLTLLIAVLLASASPNNEALVVTFILVVFAGYVFGWWIPFSFAQTVRRFHDIGKSGWIYLLLMIISVVPLIGIIASIIWIVYTCRDSDPEENQYGANPKLSNDWLSKKSPSTSAGTSNILL